MKRLFILVMVVAMTYSGYWFVGSRTMKNSASDALAGMTDAGWQVDYASLRTRGFPSRFDTTATDLVMTSPAGVQYAAPFVQAFALSYRPNRIIAAFPPAQTITIGGQTLTIASDGMKASGAVRANTALSFAEATIVSDMLAISNEAAAIRMRDVLVAARAAGDANYDLYAGLASLTLPDALWRQMFPNGALPVSLDGLTFDAVVAVDQPIDRFVQTPAIVAMTLKSARLDWGDLSITASGSLSPDGRGFAAGQITIEAVGADTLLTGLANIGAIDPGLAPTAQNMIGALADQAGKVTLPISFANGQVSWGFLPLGPAPRLQ